MKLPKNSIFIYSSADDSMGVGNLGILLTDDIVDVELREIDGYYRWVRYPNPDEKSGGDTITETIYDYWVIPNAGGHIDEWIKYNYDFYKQAKS